MMRKMEEIKPIFPGVYFLSMNKKDQWFQKKAVWLCAWICFWSTLYVQNFESANFFYLFFYE